MRHNKLLCLTVVFLLTFAGCAGMTDEQKKFLEDYGIPIGAVGGTGVAILLTDNIDNSALRLLGIATGAALGAYIGNEFSEALSRQDQEKLLKAQQQAADTGDTVVFNGDPGVTGKVSVLNSQAAVKKDKVVPVRVLKDKVEETPPLALIKAPYSPNKNINVRSGPGTDYKVVSKLVGGQGVQVIGKVVDKQWFLISQADGGAATGFVYSPLMSPTKKPVSYAQTSASDVTEVQVQVPASGACKTVRQEVTTSKGTIEEDIRVCQQSNGAWKLV